MHPALSQAAVVAQATNLWVKTQATVIPIYTVMARLPDDAVNINSRGQITELLYIGIKCTISILQHIASYYVHNFTKGLHLI